ncbi:ABC-F family ATP-binding cassette domain-containing protein [Microvirga sp. W0021]|uniref:ABC-F family ATP-binding cassette domain-containing protein n=1 Tax=Hohaiivirga grylli TaxID=3133970 RepID=A0ABV0BJB9_9HYPH
MTDILTLKGISYNTPNGRQLFNKFDFSIGRERIALVGANGCGKTTLLQLISGQLKPVEGQIIAHGKIGFLRQILDHESNQSIAEVLNVHEGIERLSRIEQGKAEDDDLELADWFLEAEIGETLTKLGLGNLDITQPFGSLSGGQKTRIEIARLLLEKPDLILLDEPTNNLDVEGRELVQNLMLNWQGGALIASHDRKLLSSVDCIVELSETGVSRFGGNWDFYKQQKDREVAAAEHALARAQLEQSRAEKDAQERIERQQQRDARGKKARSSGVPKVLLDARKDRAGRTKSRTSQLSGHILQNTEQEIHKAQERLEIIAPRNFSLKSGFANSGKTLIEIASISGGYDPGQDIISNFSLRVHNGDRIALVGSNGSGKSTLLQMIAGTLPVTAGEIRRFSPVYVLDQHVQILNPEESIFENFKRLKPDSNDNECRAALAKFMFRADASLRKVSELSGGEKMRAAMACIFGHEPLAGLLILDEPTNHLDIQSIEELERALQSYEGALIVVSHDKAFLEAIGIKQFVSLDGISF